MISSILVMTSFIGLVSAGEMTSKEFRAALKMKDVPLIPMLGPFGSNQFVAALNAVCPEA
jgi:hypothetical protein